jgi:hypothetical protein
MDENKRSLLAWFINHFWGRVTLTFALLAALGFLMGGYSAPSFRRANALVSVMALNRNPAKYEARAICVKGQVLDLRVEDNKLVRPYTVFSLQETAPDGSYDFINIISLRLPAFEKGAGVKACGYFSKVKQIGKDTYYNSLLMNSFELDKPAGDIYK